MLRPEEMKALFAIDASEGSAALLQFAPQILGVLVKLETPSVIARKTALYFWITSRR